MKLSTKARYALRAMAVMSRLSKDSQPVSLERIARRTRLSRLYLEKLSISLRQADLIRGVSGRAGGHLLSRPAEEITVGQIVEASIGPINVVNCVLEPDSCVCSQGCECREVYCLLNDKIREVLYGITLAEVASRKPRALLGQREVSCSPDGKLAQAGERSGTMTENTANKLVLVVEDQDDERLYLTTLLEDTGYDVVTAPDGVAALEVIRRDKPNLVTLDISMPSKSGLGFYREVKTDPGLAATPIVVVSAVTGQGGDSDALKRFMGTRKDLPPPEGFVPKPFEKQDLLDTVADLLA